MPHALVPRPPTVLCHFGLLALVTVVGCASRTVPDTFPRASPASTQAPELPPARVDRALSGDPPLPGQPTEGWPGLRAPDDPAEDGPSTYACPMHPEVTSSKPGSCPKCGMSLRKIQ
jgi:hypothetical protein